METDINYIEKKALLVEDNEMNIMLFSFLLKKIKINFDIARDGEEAISKFNTTNYDIVLTDIHLPKIEGDELAKIIRKSSDTAKAKTPIIALTASILTSETDAYLACGINYVLLKPFTEEKFKAVLKQYLQ
ncbi:response regulator [Parasediminibacterium sp. JCM 36343]|uniref:response regulator n=1 Tax=Parasediminibacterium sp. JCM 36343 TaxID=3374279 RepID=UPI0039786001